LTDESTGSATYVDLATIGPTVTMVTGSEVLIDIGASMRRPGGAGFNGHISIAVSGATTLAASDDNASMASSPGGSFEMCLSRTFRLTGLTPGTNTFTMKYRATSTFNYQRRSLTVQVL
jgi:hypothetical protein